MEGFITLQRQILGWEWWSDMNTFRLWITILLLANFEDKKWHGIEVRRGQLLTSIGSLSKKSGLSVRSVRTALKHLKSTGEVTCTPTNRYTLITVEKYDIYQLGGNGGDTKTDTLTDNEVTKYRQSSDKVVTTTKELKNLRIKESSSYMNDKRDGEEGKTAIPLPGDPAVRKRLSEVLGTRWDE